MKLSALNIFRLAHPPRRWQIFIVLAAMMLPGAGRVIAQPGAHEEITKPAPQTLLPRQAARAERRAVMLALDSSSVPSSSSAACEPSKKSVCENLVQDNILWRVSEPDNPASKHWLQENLDKLCACTTDPYATVNCFQVQVNNKGKTWQEAIALCHADR